MSQADFIFWCLALFTVGSAVATAVSRQIVRSAVWLMFTLAGVAGLYFLLGFEFLGATQMIVYVGGVLVLVVFAVMLTARQSAPAATPSCISWLISLLAAGGLAAVLLTALFSTTWNETATPALPVPRDAGSSDRLALTLVGSTNGETAGLLPAAPGHRKHLVHYLFVFEIVSVHLLVVLIGAAYLARVRSMNRGAA